MTSSTLPGAFHTSLVDIFERENILTDKAECWTYGYDNSRKHAQPDAVVFATSHQQIKKLVELCNQYEIPIVARGRGTGTTGATVPLQAGIVLSLERMNKIIKIDSDNRVAVVQPGVTNQALQDAAAEHGFFWPPDPTSAAFCTIGGNLAYNSAGPRAVKYGTPRENILGLTAVTGEGKELIVGTYTTKGVVGFDLTRLIVGSEGTLAIITEATLKLTPLAESKRVLQSTYKDINSAAIAVSAIMAQPFTPCALEFIDGNAIKMVKAYSDADLPDNAGAMLMIEIDGPLSALDEGVLAIQNAASNSGLLEFKEAKTKKEIDALWATRKALSPALRNVAPKKINEDVVVPVSHIPDLINGLEKLSAKYDVKIVNFGHAGNGNIHVNLLVNPDDKEEMKRAEECLDKVFSLVIDLNGTLSGEHGVGIEKRDFVDREITPNSLGYMRQIKTMFDPKGILNPDKMFPLI
ncbi:MAG: FAD-binding protein [Gammaproteobacteria bacterium]|nr:FAD-binding protein [Gammaproteobacteria bacterium]